MSPPESTFVHPNTSSVQLHLSAWKSGGCPILHFLVQHRPKYLQGQWTSEKLEASRDLHVIRHLSPDRDYVVMVTAHSEAGHTQGEYNARTLPASALGTLVPNHDCPHPPYSQSILHVKRNLRISLEYFLPLPEVSPTQGRCPLPPYVL